MDKLYYNYDLQVWIENGKVAPCCHSTLMRPRNYCCNAARWRGMTENEALAVSKA